MTSPNIIGFATYPVKKPVHGGQRRIAAFGDFLRQAGVTYECMAVYDDSYAKALAGPFDILRGRVDDPLAAVPDVGDVLAGMFGAGDERAFRHFDGLVRSRMPMAIVLEQPFMWPLVERLRKDPALAEIPVIYSSQNWEAPLKYEMLRQTRVRPEQARQVRERIEALERAVVRASRAVLAVSESDAAIYRGIAPGGRVVVVKNGTDRPPRIATAPVQEFGGSPYVFFVGSPYFPNVDGICDLLIDGGLFFFPPHKRLAICGGAADAIREDARYRRFARANGARVQFFRNVSNEDLWSLKDGAHVFVLPIKFGGGSNLKTAEALAAGKWIVATSTALRGFEEFSGAPGVLVADTRADFRRAVIKAFHSPPLQLSDADKERREAVYWDRRFAGLTLEDLGLRQP